MSKVVWNGRLRGGWRGELGEFELTAEELHLGHRAIGIGGGGVDGNTKAGEKRRLVGGVEDGDERGFVQHDVWRWEPKAGTAASKHVHAAATIGEGSEVGGGIGSESQRLPGGAAIARDAKEPIIADGIGGVRIDDDDAAEGAACAARYGRPRGPSEAPDRPSRADARP